MTRQNADRVIDAWLRQELDAVPEPARAVQEAVDAAAAMPQRHGRWAWLRGLLGLGAGVTDRDASHGPEIVLLPQGSALEGPSASGVLPRQASTPTVVVSLAVAVALIIAIALVATDPRWSLLGGSPASTDVTPTTTTPETPLRPLDPRGPDGRAIVVDPRQSGHFTTLAGAIAAAEPGDRIELLSGTYRESVVIDNDIHIAGIGERETIVVEPRPLAIGLDEKDHPRTVIELLDSSATLQGFTVRGARHGSSVVIDGGSPTLTDMIIDPVDDQWVGGPNDPHHSIIFRGASSATVRDSLLTGLAWISDGATPFIEGTRVEGACILIDGEGTAPVVRTTEFRDSQCPGFSISIAGGASATLEANPIYSSPETAGIRVAGTGSTAQVNGSTISGGREGILVGSGAEVTIHTTQISDADVGIRIYDADVELLTNRLTGNGIGLEVSGSGHLETDDNHICDNDTNLDLRDGAAVSATHNQVCAEGNSEPIAATGS